MKTILALSPHSFVDLITNSSSEVFVCPEGKTIEAIKKILCKLLETHNELENWKTSFEEAFGAIKVAKYTFDYEAFPPALLEEYEKYSDNPTRNFWSSNTGYMATARYQDLEHLSSIAEKEIGCREPGLYDKDKEEYNRRYQAYYEKRNKIWKEWAQDKAAAEAALFRHFCKENGVKISKKFEKALLELCKDRWMTKDKRLTKKELEAWDAFNEYLGWGMTVKKGDIFVYSKGDNSIPWSVIDSVESYLGARRYHLG